MTLREHGEAVEIEVRDTGPGVPADRIPHIFDRFYRAGTPRPGAGLGLAIVDQIASVHNGWPRRSRTSHADCGCGSRCRRPVRAESHAIRTILVRRSELRSTGYVVSTSITAGTAQHDPKRTESAETVLSVERRRVHERLRRLRLNPVLLIPALATLAIGAWDLGTPSYWRDEAATLDAEARSVPALLHMLTNVDAVHGAYYLLMWPIVHTSAPARSRSGYPRC